MIIFKIWYHILAIVKKFLYKILYRKKIEIAKNVTWRRDFSVMIEKNGKLQIGKGCFFNNGCTIGVNKSVIIENVVFLERMLKFTIIIIDLQIQPKVLKVKDIVMVWYI